MDIVRSIPVPSRLPIAPADVRNFARASTATYFDSVTNTIKTAAINEARFEGGLLVMEEARTNLLPDSENSAGWFNNTPNTPIPGAILGLNGTRLIQGSVAGDSPHRRALAATPAGSIQVASFLVDLSTWVGSGTVAATSLLIDVDGAQYVRTTINPLTGAVSGISTNGGANVSAPFGGSRQISGSIWLIWAGGTFAKAATGGVNTRGYCNPLTNASQIVVAAPQLEIIPPGGALAPTSYIPTLAGLTATRAADSGDKFYAVQDDAPPLKPLALADYQNLITSEHNDKPLYMAVIAALVQGLADIGNKQIEYTADFDLDLAVGVQLDAVGEWVGITRYLPTPLTGVYFSWDATALLGWDSGVWQGPFDPSTGLTTLPDDQYRLVLKAKIAANQWDGTVESAQAIWNLIFAGTGITVIMQDMQDMSIVVAFQGPPLSAVQQALLTGGYFPLKPSGVRIRFYGIPVDTGPLFAWDADSNYLKGWDTGAWVKEL